LILRGILPKLSYLKVIEPHKDFTPHLHSIIFIKKSDIPKFFNHFKNTLQNFSLGEQYDFTILENVEASVSYIMKYVKKSVNSDNITDMRLIDGWKKINKIRMFTHSQIHITRDVYKIASRHIDLKSEENSYSILQNMLDKCNIHVDYFYKEDGNEIIYRSKIHNSSFAQYNIYLKKYKNVQKKFDKISYIIDDFKHYTRYEDLYMSLYSSGFNFYDFLQYVYDIDYFDTELFYLSNDFNFYDFFINYDFFLFRDYLLSYYYEKINFETVSYSISDFIIKENGFLIYDKKDFELLI